MLSAALAKNWRNSRRWSPVHSPLISVRAMTSMRNEGWIARSWTSFHFLIILTSGFHCSEKFWFAAVAIVAWVCGLVWIHAPRTSSGIR